MDSWRKYPDKALQCFRRGREAGVGAEWDGGEVHVAVVGMGQITSGLTSHGKDLAFTLSEMGAV